MDRWMDGFFMSKPRSTMFRWIPTFLVVGMMLSSVAPALVALPWRFWVPAAMYRGSHLSRCLPMHVSKGYTGLIYGPPVGGICACKMKVVFGF